MNVYIGKWILNFPFFFFLVRFYFLVPMIQTNVPFIGPHHIIMVDRISTHTLLNVSKMHYDHYLEFALHILVEICSMFVLLSILDLHVYLSNCEIMNYTGHISQVT